MISLNTHGPEDRQHDVRRARRRPQRKRPAATLDAERAVAEPSSSTRWRRTRRSMLVSRGSRFLVFRFLEGEGSL